MRSISVNNTNINKFDFDDKPEFVMNKSIKDLNNSIFPKLDESTILFEDKSMIEDISMINHSKIYERNGIKKLIMLLNNYALRIGWIKFNKKIFNNE